MIVDRERHAPVRCHQDGEPTIHDLRIAEVVVQDIQIAHDGTLTYRTKLRVSFKCETSG